MGGTRGSGVLSSAGDVLEMSVMRGEGKERDMCMCLARGWRCWGEWIGFGLYQSWRNRGKVAYMAVFWLRWCWCWGSGCVAWARVWEDGVKSVFVVSLDSLC